jgi:hypothetical protein
VENHVAENICSFIVLCGRRQPCSATEGAGDDFNASLLPVPELRTLPAIQPQKA